MGTTLQGGAAQAFIAFLRCEATQAEQRAKSLRATAAAIEANLGGRRKKRKRGDSGEKTKKGHTAYTLYVHESYELVKKDHPGLSSKDLIGIMTRQWGEMSDEQKLIWKYRADQIKEQSVDPTIMAELTAAAPELDDTAAALELPTDGDGGGKKPAATKRAVAKSASV